MASRGWELLATSPFESRGMAPRGSRRAWARTCQLKTCHRSDKKYAQNYMGIKPVWAIAVTLCV